MVCRASVVAALGVGILLALLLLVPAVCESVARAVPAVVPVAAVADAAVARRSCVKLLHAACCLQPAAACRCC